MSLTAIGPQHSTKSLGMELGNKKEKLILNHESQRVDGMSGQDAFSTLRVCSV